MLNVSFHKLDQLAHVQRVHWATPSPEEAVFLRHAQVLIRARNHYHAYQANVERDAILSHAD